VTTARRRAKILLQVMDNSRDHLIVILAGCADRMDGFFRSNPGFRSRVAHHIDFPDYTEADVIAIGEKMLASLSAGFPKRPRGACRIYSAQAGAARERQGLGDALEHFQD
jgi:hypothetical protein